jgi:two-component system, chemotaxis family, CheB/CheR fusion protein
VTISAPKKRRVKPSLVPPLCVAGIGASAGGFEAIRDFFHTMPADSGIAFVVVQHLAPSHVSMAAEIFAKFTPMPVLEATEGMALEANHVYTSPSDKDLTLRGGCLHLTPREASARIRLPIDHFFSSLGEDCATRAIGMVFSGTGSDGALGLKAIAAHGGVVLVQKPETAEYDGMPRSAIATGVVNYVLPVTQMPNVISSYAHHPYVASVDATDGVDLPLEKSSALKQLIQIIQVKRGYDFSGYKHGTLVRRIERRMGLHGLLKHAEYVAFLKANPDEVDALFKDLLIGVTEFFRDPEAWKSLENTAIAPLVAGKDSEDAIRIWIPGCSTGEEAYTMAIMVRDRVRRARKNCQVQIFATDTNNDALEIGRIGRYPGGIAARIAPKQLQRYFTTGPEPLSCIVSDELRKMVVFGTQNLFADPPFGRVDLISCRNVLIYLEPEVQKRVLNIFHFALRKDGYLFLGSAESNGARDDLFRPISKKFRIYQRQGSARLEILPPPLPIVDSRTGSVSRSSTNIPGLSLVASVAQRLIMDHFAPAAVVVNDNQEVVYFCGPTDDFLIRPRGAPTHDLMLMVREGLRARLRMALKEASISKMPVTVTGARMKREGAFVPVRIAVVPSGYIDADNLYLVAFFNENLPTLVPSGDNTDAALVNHLEQELAVTRADLQNTVEKFETSTESLRISNEEVVSTNEELRSLNEELESSKEELQSLNEELTTVNQQLEVKVRELEASNGDLQNLLTSSDIATICLDETLRIKWFTPATQTQFGFLPTDAGRPIANMVAAIGDPSLLMGARSVLSNQVVLDHEFETDKGRWFLRKILPYKDAHKTTSGVILTFTDITDTHLANQAAQLTRDDLIKSVSQSDQMRMMSMAMVSAEEHERRSLAQDLHDDLGQLLAIVSLKISSMEKLDLPVPVRRSVNDCSKSIEHVHRKLRSMTLQLSPPILDSMGLVPAMKWLADEVYGLYKLDVSVEDDGAPKPMQPEVSVTVFRAVRELLLNVAKHAGVFSAVVKFKRLDRNFMTVNVSDAGAGFNQDAVLQRSAKGGFGLLSVKERIGFMGGDVSVQSVPGDGTSVTLKIPLLHTDEVSH